MTAVASTFQPPTMKQIARDVLLGFLNDKPVGTRLPPIKDLAGDLGVGQSSLHEAMRGLADDGVLVSRPRLGTYLAMPVSHDEDGSAALTTSTATNITPSRNHRPTRGASQLIGARVAIKMYDPSDESIESIYRSLQEALAARGISTYRHLLNLADNVELLKDDDADLHVMINPTPSMAKMSAGDQPHVVISTSWHPETRVPMPCDLIGVQQRSGTEMLGQHLSQLGHGEDICFIGVHKRDGSGELEEISTLRLEGLEAGLGNSIPKQNIVNGKGFSLVAGGTAYRHYKALKHHPKMIVTICDDVAVGFIVAAEADGLQVGRDYCIAGFDGQLVGKRLFGGPLTTVQIPFSSMGRVGADAVVSRLMDPDRPLQSTFLECQLFEGNTAQHRADG